MFSELYHHFELNIAFYQCSAKGPTWDETISKNKDYFISLFDYKLNSLIISPHSLHRLQDLDHFSLRRCPEMQTDFVILLCKVLTVEENQIFKQQILIVLQCVTIMMQDMKRI